MISRLQQAMYDSMLTRQMDLFERQMALLENLISKKDEEDDEEKLLLSSIDDRLKKSQERQIQLSPS